MHHYEYQFENGIGEDRKRFQRRLRLALLFVLIAALTAGIIYFVIPKENKKPQLDGEPDNAVEKVSAVEKAAEIAGEKNISGTVSDTEKNASGTAVDVTPDNAENSDSEKLSGEQVSGAPVQVPTDEPQKGKPWKGDPANDTPVVVENRITADIQLDGLKDSFSERKYSATARVAVDLVCKENEGSPVYRTAAEYLRRSRIEELSSKDGVFGVSFRYVIRGGDSLSRIARRNSTTVQALMSYNHLENGLIRIGNKLTVTPGPWKIVVSKSKRLLKLHQGKESRLFCVFEVGVGRGNSTPKGEFVVSTRLKDPKWYAPDGRIFEPGEDGNELGKYFLKLAAAGNPDRPLLGYGIHGTPDENTVGNSVSSGCIRMRSADIEMLYNLVPEKTPVVITD